MTLWFDTLYYLSLFSFKKLDFSSCICEIKLVTSLNFFLRSIKYIKKKFKSVFTHLIFFSF